MQTWSEEKKRKAVRDAVDEELAERNESALTDAEWRWAQSRPWAKDTDDEDALAASIAHYVPELRSAQTGGYVPRPAEEMISLGERRFPSPSKGPSWWQSETERRFEDLRPLQAKVLAMLGAVDDEGGPRRMALEEIYSHLKTIAESETRGGDAWSLPVPLGYDRDGNGFWLNELVVRRGSPFEEQRLWRLAEAADEVVRKTGCSEDQALVFLLADQVPSVPWVQTSYDGRYGVIRLEVRSAFVPASDVANDYRSLRDLLFGKKRSGGKWPSVAGAFRQQGKWTNWAETFTAFKAEHADQPYTNLGSFRNAIYNHTKRDQKRLAAE